MFTTPTLRNYAVMLDDTGRELQVVFFDADMVRNRQLIPETAAPDVFHKTAGSLVEALLAAPRVAISEKQTRT